MSVKTELFKNVHIAFVKDYLKIHGNKKDFSGVIGVSNNNSSVTIACHMKEEGDLIDVYLTSINEKENQVVLTFFLTMSAMIEMYSV